jgi:hypothetical protein
MNINLHDVLFSILAVYIIIFVFYMGVSLYLQYGPKSCNNPIDFLPIQYVIPPRYSGDKIGGLFNIEEEVGCGQDQDCLNTGVGLTRLSQYESYGVANIGEIELSY